MRNPKTILIIAFLVLLGSVIGCLIGFYSGARWADMSLSKSVDISLDNISLESIEEMVSYDRESAMEKAEQHVFDIALKAVTDYRSSLQWGENLTIESDAEDGFIETNWYPVHKGEVSEKVQVFVWGDNYRVDVWHGSSGSKFRVPYKGDHARAREIRLQEAIEAGLSSGNQE